MVVDKENFFIAYHTSLTDDLNHISEDLLRAKWFFLAAIGAAGTAYWNLHNVACNSGESATFKETGYLIICLMGNVIFWLISEYSLSHAFLFRNIQARLIGIEHKFDKKNSFNDPTKINNFIYYDKKNKKLRLLMEYIMPDQFVPIYWASIWLIIVNTGISAYLQGENIHPNELKSTIYILISVPLIWKLWTYYCYKLNKFIDENCKFKLFYGMAVRNIKDYYQLSTFSMSLVGALIFAVIYYLFARFDETIPLEHYSFLFFAVLGWFWPVYTGLFLHIFRTFFQWQLHNEPACLIKIFPDIYPEVRKISRRHYRVVCSDWTRIIYVLYNIA